MEAFCCLIHCERGEFWHLLVRGAFKLHLCDEPGVVGGEYGDDCVSRAKT